MIIALEEAKQKLTALRADLAELGSSLHVEELRAKIKADGYNKVYMFAPHSKSVDQYYATFELNGEKCVVYFQAVEKSLSLLRYYNKNTIVTVVSK